MVIKFHIKIIDDKRNLFEQQSDFKGKKYMRLDPSVFLTLECKDSNKESAWDASRSVMITSNNISLLIVAMKKVLSAIYTKDVFSMKKNGTIILNSDIANQYIETVQLNTSNALKIMPSVIYDDNDISYEGVVILVNNNANIISLPIQFYEALIYVLEKIDIFSYSQLLINYVVSRFNIDEIINKEPTHSSETQNRVDFSKPVIESNKPQKQDDLFLGLEGVK
jgi:hypothetical protein